MLMGCISVRKEEEYRSLVENFADWNQYSHLQLNARKTKELMVDFQKKEPPLVPATIQGENIKVVNIYEYLGLHLCDKLG